MNTKAPSPLAIHVDLRIEPASFVRGVSKPPILSTTATLSGDQPVTIFTWPTIFHLGQAQQRDNFVCNDLVSNESIKLGIWKIRRAGFSRTKGEGDDECFVTLMPEIPVTFSESLAVASRVDNVTGTFVLPEGHSFRFGVHEGEKIEHWWYGTRDDVMVPSEYPEAELLPSSGEPIPLKAEAVEFEVKRAVSEA